MNLKITKNFVQMKTEEIKRTSSDWQQLKPETIVYDPDGWDRKNYQYSWFEELITEQQYTDRLCRSTCFKPRWVEKSTTVDTYNDLPPKLPKVTQPIVQYREAVPFKEPSGELRENINSNMSWLKSALSALKLVKRPKK